MMSTKKPPNGMHEPDVEYRQDHDLPMLTAEEEKAVDAYLRRNRDAINASIRKSREELKRGETRTLDEVMAKLRTQRKHIAKDGK